MSSERGLMDRFRVFRPAIIQLWRFASAIVYSYVPSAAVIFLLAPLACAALCVLSAVGYERCGGRPSIFVSCCPSYFESVGWRELQDSC